MKIQNQNNLSFKSSPIQKVHICNAKTGEFIPAMWTKLNPKDGTDRKAVAEIYAHWNADDIIMGSIADNFNPKTLETHQYNAIELIGKEPLPERIMAVSKAFPEENTSYLQLEKIFYLNDLIVKPETSYCSANRFFKNIGEVLFGGIIKQAKTSKFDCLHFFSESDPFYFKILEKAGIDANKEEGLFYLNKHEFRIDKKYFDQILDYWSKTFKTKLPS